MSEIIKVEHITDHVTEVLINRPENYNTFNTELRLSLAENLRKIGKNKDKFFKINSLSNNFPYVHDTIGTNARITEIQSCIGNYQLKKLKNYINNYPRLLLLL